MAVQAQRFCFSRLPSHLCQYKMSAFYFSLCFLQCKQNGDWGKKMLPERQRHPKRKETSCHTGSSICSESMICGGLARTLAHMPITQEHHLLFCLLGGSLLAPRYFTVTQLAQAQGLKCALHSAVGNQCSLWILYLRTEEPSSQLFTSCDRCFYSHTLAPLHSQPTDIIFASDFYGVYQVNPHDFYLLGDVFGLMLRIIYDPGGGVKLLSHSIFQCGHRFLEKFPGISQQSFFFTTQISSWWQIKLLWYKFKAIDLEFSIF